MKTATVTPDLTPEEKNLLNAIATTRYEGGIDYPRAPWVETLCPDRNAKAVLKRLRGRGLAEVGMGGTVAGDFYTACWLTEQGEAVYRGLEKDAR